MRFVSDLHLHSKYSRAVSPSITLPVMAQFAKQKGIDILSASDFTHPLWFKEIQGQLEEVEDGIYALKSEYQNPKFETNSKHQNSKIQNKTLFLLSTEISSIYKQGGKLRRVHNLIFLPSLEAVEKFNQMLISRGCNLNADGRPIVGLSSKNLLELLLSIDERAMLIPCHIWTPHFGVYGSKSGFDSLDEAFEDLAPYVYGIETGISSDPEMNWRVKELANRSILSFSDAHSPANMGREATVFELEAPTYENIRSAIRRLSVFGPQLSAVSQSVSQVTGQPKTGKLVAENRQPKTDNRIAYTVEFYPEEGKYHFSGHRTCKVAFSPDDVIEKGSTCPVCRREFTEGVALRIEQLAGREFAKEYEEKQHDGGIKWHTDKTNNHPPYVKLVRLEQIIGGAMGIGDKSVKVKKMYEEMLGALGSELVILLHTPLTEIEKVAGSRTADGVGRVRGGKIGIAAGYDGEYGKVRIWEGPEEPPLRQGFAAQAKGPKVTVSEGQMRMDI